MNVVVTHNVLDADGFMTSGAVLVERRRHLRVASRAGTLTINGIVVGPIFGSTAPTGAPEANGRIAPHHLQMLLASGILLNTRTPEATKPSRTHGGSPR